MEQQEKKINLAFDINKELQKQMRLKTRELRLIEKRVGELKLKK